MERQYESKNCPFCKEEIHKDAIKCKHCGSMLISITPQAQNTEKEGSLWVAIISLICGIIVITATLNVSVWDGDIIKAFIVFCFISLLCGFIGISKKLQGQGMAITGVVLSILAILFMIGG